MDGGTLGVRARSEEKPKKALAHLVDQLKAAKSTGQPVYLAVSDAIKEAIVPLRAFLRGRDLGDVKVVTFAESKLKEVSNTLRKGLGLTAGVATVAADQMNGEEFDD